MKLFIYGAFILCLASYQAYSQSSYSSASQDTELNSKANTQGDTGYINEDIEEQQEDINFSGEMDGDSTDGYDEDYDNATWMDEKRERPDVTLP